jgi:hypothetical protein
LAAVEHLKVFADKDAILSKTASLRLPNAALVSYHQWMPSKPIELPPAAARRFVEDMRAFFKETNQIKQHEIAARQLLALGQSGRLWLYLVLHDL